MDILTKNIELEVDLPITTLDIDKALAEKSIKPLRYAIVKVEGNILTINVTYENL